MGEGHRVLPADEAGVHGRLQERCGHDRTVGELTALLHDAGFADVDAQPVTGPFWIVTGRRWTRP